MTPPAGLCECGCGQRTNIHQATRPRHGQVKGQPARFVQYHQMRRGPLVERVLSRIVIPVDAQGGCWEWLGHKNHKGYGRLSVFVDGHSRSCGVHRITYEHFVGPIPEGLTLDHLCRNRGCVNPNHLEPVTRGENVRRGLRGVLRTHCKHGHPATPENTLTDGSGQRRCKPCRDAYHEAYRAVRRARYAARIPE